MFHLQIKVEGILHNYFSGEQIVSGWKAKLKELRKIFWITKPEKEIGGLVK